MNFVKAIVVIHRSICLGHDIYIYITEEQFPFILLSHSKSSLNGLSKIFKGILALHIKVLPVQQLMKIDLIKSKIKIIGLHSSPIHLSLACLLNINATD